MEVKGAAVYTIPFFIRNKFGEQGYQKWIRSLSPKAKSQFIKGIVHTEWYPVKEMMIEPSKIFSNMFYEGKLDGVVEQGRFSAEQALKEVSSVFIKLSPETILDKASQILTTYYKPAAVEVTDNGNKKVSVKISSFDEPHIIIEARIKGWIERGLELSGVKTPKATIITSMCTGAPFTEYIVTWI